MLLRTLLIQFELVSEDSVLLLSFGAGMAFAAAQERDQLLLQMGWWGSWSRIRDFVEIDVYRRCYNGNYYLHSMILLNSLMSLRNPQQDPLNGPLTLSI